MRYSPLVERIDGPGARAWEIHGAAVAARRRGEDVILLTVGDPDFATPAPIVETAIAALRDGDTHYSDVPGRPALREAIAGHLSPGFGRNLSADEVVVTAGAQNALFSAALCLLQEGDEAIVLEPAYLTYEATLQAAGARLVRVPMPAAHGFRPDADAIRAAVTDRTRAIVLATPNNPTGVVLTRDELLAIAKIAVERDLWVISDEVYAALTFDRPHVSIASLPGMAERTVTIGSLSKSHAMTGWRVGWIAGPPDLVRHVERLELSMLYGLPGFIQEAAITAIAQHEAIAADMRRHYRARRDIVVAALAETPRLSILSPDAGMFVMVDVRRTGLSPFDFAWRLFRETGVSTLDATAFGSPADGFLRVAFTLGEERLAEACRRIDGFVRGL
ncbi:aspartate aminotransferase [Aureimonas sp. Leaf454]|uniref:pyridoxal phosphate-dependent aminotransferase n=1 Tax=Aureimonas sp. Leaf454 TaxID=1736381 RepID=UPI0006F7418A|nr:aminotransferase class I/II-fold pyridoxal phosphate-dependent enzyme [Aureimonas sp. Leaf454]KQT46251.1 aspartate aminotransferase [Aureimonas sp. Leaf454]